MESNTEREAGSPLLLANSILMKGRILWGLFGLSLAIQALIYGAITSKPVIRSDGVGYQAYLPALVDRDFSFETLARREFPEGMPFWTGIRQGPTGYVTKYPLGLSLLQAPFFGVAHAVARAGGCKSFYSLPYQIAAAVSGAWYFAWGGLCVWILLRRLFEQNIALLALLLTVCGTNLLHYATYDASFSHVYSFFLFAALLVTSRDLYQAQTKWWLASGALVGLTLVTRPTNGVVLIFVLADWLGTAGSLQEAILRIRRKWWQCGCAALVAAVPIVLQLAYWKAATGMWFFYSYGGEGFRFFQPAGLRLLFGFEKGWFVYVPLAGVAVFGWLVACRKLFPDARVTLTFAILNIWIIASWHDWGYGGAFSIRPLVDSSPLIALGLAGALWRVWPILWARRLCLTLCALCAIYTMVLMLGYWMKVLPYILATGDDIIKCLRFSWLFH
jgi:hypothetical protein